MKFNSKNIWLSFIIMLVFASCSRQVEEHNENELSFTRYVDPYIGTGFHGHVFLGANVPFGAVQLGPTNLTQGWDWCSGYHYSDTTLIGFAHTHLSGTGIGDLGDILFHVGVLGCYLRALLDLQKVSHLSVYFYYHVHYPYYQHLFYVPFLFIFNSFRNIGERMLINYALMLSILILVKDWR